MIKMKSRELKLDSKVIMTFENKNNGTAKDAGGNTDTTTTTITLTSTTHFFNAGANNSSPEK